MGKQLARQFLRVLLVFMSSKMNNLCQCQVNRVLMYLYTKYFFYYFEEKKLLTSRYLFLPCLAIFYIVNIVKENKMRHIFAIAHWEYEYDRSIAYMWLAICKRGLELFKQETNKKICSWIKLYDFNEQDLNRRMLSRTGTRRNVDILYSNFSCKYDKKN